ncbi:unnamed protein product [Rangifer tarandus platyrhynchus]|uniref:Uncharacterized protein n=3 Tax=Rangifer tarandus platyrhynchus TaxID=3082113 RepID=A0ACB0FFC5_RANTA|nr:unnamed protein product [Rangifer tarandus platyrhynchus]CAI9711508.1 unnamed protein product [Rangifer tarandus platyrhynchus]
MGLRSDHVLNVCLRLNLHLREAGKPEPPEASHLARPRPRSLGGPFLPPSSSTRRQQTLPAGGPRGPAALIRRQQAKLYERVRPAVHVYSGFFTLARILIQGRHLLAADSPALQRSRPRLGGGGGAAEAAPPTKAGEWSAQHPLSSGSGTLPSSVATVAQDCPSDF